MPRVHVLLGHVVGLLIRGDPHGAQRLPVQAELHQPAAAGEIRPDLGPAAVAGPPPVGHLDSRRVGHHHQTRPDLPRPSEVLYLPSPSTGWGQLLL